VRTTLTSALILGVGLSIVGCSGTDSSSSGVGGDTSVGGSLGTGGAATAGGSGAIGGSTGGASVGSSTAPIGGASSGGAMSTGGSPTTGGTTTGVASTGGTKTTGGATNGGGSPPTGGNAPTGGTVSNGGSVAATGGTKAAAGGTSTSVGTGGFIAATGGSGPATGGSKATAGASATGGSKATGGSAATAGAGGSGGTAGSTFVEDDGTDCTIGPMPTTLTSNTKLPDPFTKLDGTRMTTKAEWRCRREEIRKLAEKYAYGTKPPPAPTVTGTVSRTSITVNVTDGGKSSNFTATVTLPTSGTAPYPVIITYTAAPLDSAVINSEGVALINYNPYDAGAEGTGRASKSGAFYTLYGSTSTTGLLVAWGWGVSRIIDVIAKSDGTILKADAVGVTGCSRFGKGSFIAGVFDQRIALTMPIESGTGGVPIWRNVNTEGAQSLSSAYGEQPWFGDAFSAFTGNNAATAPIDTHEAIAMIAPRGLFIMDNPHIANLGPKSAYIAAVAGAEVYKALGAGDAITYYSNVANGTHCSQRPEWSTPLRNNIQRFLKKTGTAPGAINAYSGTTTDLATWRTWTTPTLN